MSDAAVENLVIEIRDHYVAQFRAFLIHQRAVSHAGSPEVKFELPEGTAAYRKWAVVDFLRTDDGPESIFFEPEGMLVFDPIEGQMPSSSQETVADLTIEGLRWDAVTIEHDLPAIEEAIADWFEKWFDPDEVDYDPEAELTGCVHSVYVAPQRLHVDLGTASAEAFWELLEALVEAKATKIRVVS
ncbi:hypothetical protein [Novosphingobium rosa]|uniref:hypothetical protein n=1 Tax=Novosphingobium rosa TaxID=76978 RepID=UPI0008331FD6|nr:hypothetical protein [Novosphingobium rosa]